MSRNLISELRKIHPSGKDGFEGLVARLLETLTGQYFHLAQSGTQLGRDMSAGSVNHNVIAVECKRYGDKTELDERELIGELVQAATAIPDLDLWVLIASRSIPSQLHEALRSTSDDCGITYFSISTDDGTPSSLELLCAQAIDLTLDFLEPQTTQSDLRKSLEEIANSTQFNTQIERLREELLSPLVGYCNWATEQKRHFYHCLESKQDSRACFGQVIDVASDNIKVIQRKSIWTCLDEWLKQWENEPSPFVILGEEGDGKTWSAASWLSKQIKHNPEFPPVLFLSSTNVDSNDPETLISRTISHYSSALTHEAWKKRIKRWTKRNSAAVPLLFLVLDGINERRAHDWWRELLERLAGQPWFNQVAVLITCRSAYWQSYFGHLQTVTHVLSAYDDAELDEALAYKNLRRSDIQPELLTLIRKPRYFDLMVRYRERVAETGDVTTTRLIYEDWRDRFERKRGIPLNDEAFQILIRDLALEFQKGNKYISARDIDTALPSFEDRQRIFEELRTGGILKGSRRGYQVDQQRLTYGFGLLLVNELEQVTELSERNLTDVLATLLEPHPEMNIKAAICEFATLHAFSLRDYPREAKIALLQAWVNSRNPAKTAENNFMAYCPLDPESYISLAEVVWSDANENPWAQELLMQSFLRWRESSNVVSDLRSAFERWLGFVHVNGFPSQRGVPQEPPEKAREEISRRLNTQVHVGQQFEFNGYVITLIEDDGLLRLGRAALAIISHLPRSSFVKAMATGCLAEAIMNFPNKYRLFAWVIQSTTESIWIELQAEVDRLLSTGHVFAQQAAHRLLSFEGSPEAHQLQQTLPQNLFPPDPLIEEYRQDPCAYPFQWTQADCEICLFRNGISSDQIARQLKQHCFNPDLAVPDDLEQRLSPLTESISISQLRTSLCYDRDDHALSDYEPSLCAYAPNALLSLVQRIARHIDEREGIPLRQLSLLLKEYSLVLGTDEYDSIYRAWTRLLSKANSWSEPEDLAEMFLFQLVLQAQDAETQLFYLLQRPESAADLISYEHSFLPITDWTIICEPLESAMTVKIQRTLWFLSAHSKLIPKDIVRKYILPVLDHENAVIRSTALKILYLRKDLDEIEIFIKSLWTWSNSERHWGSLLLCECGTAVPFAEICDRTHPTYLGYALHCRGMKELEVRQYADRIQSIWLKIATEIPDVPPDCPAIEVAASVLNDQDLVMTHWQSLADQDSPSITFLDRQVSWGGIDKTSSNDTQEFLLGDDQRDQYLKMRSKARNSALTQQAEAGNIWFAERLFPHGLEQVVCQCPELLEQWLKPIFADDSVGFKHACLSAPFYTALCEVLLQHIPTTGIRLYLKLRQLERKIYIRDVASGFELIDYAFFQAPLSGEIESAWTEILNQCKTDRDLMKIAILAQRGNAQRWLWSYIQRGTSSSPFQKAQAIVLLGFIDDHDAFRLLNSLLEEQPDTWIKDLLERSRQIWQKNNWAMHWFRSFVRSNDDVMAGASFKLFLGCIDSRFWHWRERVEAAELPNCLSEKRLVFLENNLDSLKHRVRDNEKLLTERYLGEKVLKGQAYPWM